MLNIAVFVSGGGTNLQALLDAQQAGQICGGQIVAVMASKPGVYALERAAKHGIAAEVVRKAEYADTAQYAQAMLQFLHRHQIGLIVLAGFLSIVPEEVIRAYPNKIINIHPSLIPSFCGPGFYGLRVHQAVLDAGVKVTGATVHFVNEVVDGGAILFQKAVSVEEDDTPETLQRRVMEQAEWKLLPLAVSKFCEGKIQVEGRRTRILP